jgi:hypothetical protein
VIFGRDVPKGILFAAGVASRPSGVVTLWKAATGGKAVGCLPSTPVPELLYAANLLPIPLESGEDLSLFPGQIDAWLIGADPSPFPAPPGPTPRFASPRETPVNLEEALDRIEALAEWVGVVSGSPASEGALWKSIRAYATRRSLLETLDERIAHESAILTPGERRDVVRAGNFLPPEAHSRLLSLILGVDHEPAAVATDGEKGDPLIVLARRLI